jgi:hypothetical protein
MKKIVLFLLIVSCSYSVVLDDSVKRAGEHRLYNTFTKINTIHYYINRYIMSKGEAPTNSGQIALVSNGKITIGSSGNWPREVNSLNNQITFSIIYNNTAVKYMGIFDTMPTVEILSLASKNVALKSDAYFKLNSGSTNVDLIMPLDFKTIVFLQKAVKLKGFIDNSPGCPSLTSCDYTYSVANEICESTTNNGRTWYKPNGIGGFEVKFCTTVTNTTPVTYKWVPVMDQSVGNFVDRNIYVSPFKNSKVNYSDGVNGIEAIYTDSTTLYDID